MLILLVGLIVAGMVFVTYKVWRRVQRQPSVFGWIAVVVLMIVSGLAVLIWGLCSALVMKA